MSYILVGKLDSPVLDELLVLSSSRFATGLFCLGVVLTLGEMSAYIPTSGSFATYGSRFCSPALGFTLGWS